MKNLIVLAFLFTSLSCFAQNYAHDYYNSYKLYVTGKMEEVDPLRLLEASDNIEHEIYGEAIYSHVQGKGFPGLLLSFAEIFILFSDKSGLFRLSTYDGFKTYFVKWEENVSDNPLYSFSIDIEHKSGDWKSRLNIQEGNNSYQHTTCGFRDSVLTNRPMEETVVSVGVWERVE